VKILKEHVETDIRPQCARSEMMSLAVDGWSDPRGCKYQSVTARHVDPNTLSARSRLLAMKEIKCVHESRGELQVMLERLQGKYGIQGKVRNLCTDRASINESAFRVQSADLSSAFGESLLWLPCGCHLLNNVLSFFLDRIRHRLKPIFYLQQRFRKCGPFLSSLLQEKSKVTSISSVSTVRWFSSNSLFQSLLPICDRMVRFSEMENYRIPQLNDAVRGDIERLRGLTVLFLAAQKDLEGDGYRSASRTIPHLLGIQKKLDEFREDEPDAVCAVHDYIGGLQEHSEKEWDLFTLMTCLHPSVRWQVGRTCSDGRHERIMRVLVVLVQNELDREPREPFVEPGSDDFMTFRPGAGVAAFTATGQIEHYDRIRAHRSQPLRFWSICPVDLRAMSVVAIKILSLLRTSASVERSFSTARQICSDYHMARKQETIAARAMIQVDWSVAQPLLRDGLAMGKRGWTRVSRERQERRAEQDDSWRSDIPGETEEDPGASHCDLVDEQRRENPSSDAF
jgi:hypothetical protein